jgi:hypothetical protein
MGSVRRIACIFIGMLVGTFSFVISASASAPGRSSSLTSPTPTKTSSSAAATLPTVAQARPIVENLWSRREAALAALNTAMIAPVETGSAKHQDDQYVASVRCRCEPQKDPHPLDAMIPQIPRASSDGTFFAQVRTTNARTHEHLWYVLALKRGPSGGWKIWYVNLGGYKAAPPMRWLTDSNGYTRPVNATSRAQIAHLATAYVRFVMARGPLTGRTDYGAAIHRWVRVEPKNDGIYGLALASGDVLSCFTVHYFETYSLEAGLLQGVTQGQWGHHLAPGVYRSITIDTAAPMCLAGKGVGETVGVLRFNYEQRVVAIAGVRK